MLIGLFACLEVNQQLMDGTEEKHECEFIVRFGSLPDIESYVINQPDKNSQTEPKSRLLIKVCRDGCV